MRLRYVLLCFLIALSASKGIAQSTVEFIENKGQWGQDWFRFKAVTNGGDIYLENDGLRYILVDPSNTFKMDSFHHGILDKHPVVKFHVYKVTFEGANQHPQLLGSKKQSNYYNYFLGNDPSRWKSDIHPYLAMDYNELYKGINMHLSSENGSLFYEFYVQPGASADQIKMNFDGPESMRMKGDNLIISTSVGQVTEMKPYAYQYINDNKVEVPCFYHLKNNKVTFEFPNDYDHTKQLIIDPTIVLWCSLTGSTADNWGFTATYDAAGDFYMGGLVNALRSGTSFPVSPGAYQSTWGGGSGNDEISYAADIGIMKLTPDGHTRVYATYIGGSGNERPHSLIVDNDNNLIIAGRTHSTNYPVTSTAYQPTNRGGWDIVVTKLNSTGTALVGSTYLGGSGDDGVNFDSTEKFYGHLKYNYGDDARSEVQIDNVGNIYVTGSTQSSNFPTTSTAIITTSSGMQDGVVFKMNNDLSSLLWSTYIGGTGDDAGYVLAFNASQTSLYVAGGTSSPNFPVTAGSWQSAYRGDSADGFILKFKNSPPYNVQRGTFVGTTHYDQVYGIQLDNDGNVYVMGQSLGGTFPVTAGTFTNPNSCQFIMKIDSNLTTDMISTVYGSGDPTHTNISPVAFLVDTCDNVYISGWGGNIMGVRAPGLAHSGTCSGMPISAVDSPWQATTDGYDFYFMVLGPGMTSLRYSTYYGRSSTVDGFGEHVDGGTSRFDKHGIIYQAICANCGGPGSPPFPTTAGSWATLDGSDNCNEAGLKIAFNIGPVKAIVTAGPNTSGCAPLTVNFTNTSNNALTYTWDFGDGSPTVTTYSPSHVFTSAGTYTVTLYAGNSNACFKTSDTAHIVIVVDTNIITPAFTYQITDSCGPFIATFTNTSTDHVGTPSYQWYLGDGATYSGTTPPPHNYPDTGTYTIMLIMTEPLACKTPDTVVQQVRIRNFWMDAHFTMPDSLCLGSSFTPLANTSNVSSMTWSYGDGHTATGSSSSYSYKGVGTYTVTLISQNSGACNGSDTETHVIKVLPGPTAYFTFEPTIAEANVPTTFTNKSVSATRYLWDFGDNESSVDVNPVHQYNKTGSYKACLNAYNSSNCPSQYCKMVPAEVVPLIGIPTGFSPNGDGENDILYVRGAAIKVMDLKIYNRWGQLIFESTSQDKGWDGTFNGEPQPIEAYGYVLTATFIDGTARVLKGNITLLR